MKYRSTGGKGGRAGMRYRKKPVEIEAVKYLGEMRTNNFSEVPGWLFDAIYSGAIYKKGRLCIKTLEGDHHISKGYYIIKGIKGELYACKPDIFEMTYEEVEASHD